MTGFGGTKLDAQGADASRQADLLRRTQAGDRAAFGALVVLLQDRLYNAVLRMVGNPDDARDIAQETFLRALSSVRGFRGDSAPYTWLFRIALNLCLTRRRRARMKLASLDGENGHDQAAPLRARVASGAADPSEVAEQREAGRLVLQALDALEPEQRALLVMRDVEDFDYQQMADLLGVPLGTLKSRLFRARMALREKYEAMQGGAPAAGAVG